jgi:hypothetical protein
LSELDESFEAWEAMAVEDGLTLHVFKQKLSRFGGSSDHTLFDHIVGLSLGAEFKAGWR